MLLEIILFLLAGIVAGIITGLTPGIHINLIGAAIVSGTFSIILGINPIYLVVFIVAMSISHVFLDFIPSIFLGAPEDGTELSVLPGHEMLKKGEGLQAVNLASLGCLYGLFIFLLLIFPLYFISGVVKTLPGIIIALGLAVISLSMILTEKKKFSALIVFIITGALSLIVSGMNVVEPLLPLLTGLFGSASLFISITQKTKIEKQKIDEEIKNKILQKKRTIISSAIFSPLSLFLPALSSGQIAIIGNQFVKTDKKQFLFMLGIITMLSMCLSFLGLFLVSKTRTGSAAAIKNLIGVPDWKTFILIVIVILISGILSFLITKKISKKFLVLLDKINYSLASAITIGIIFIITFLVSGFLGLIVLTVSTATGIYCIRLGVKRTNMMGCLIIPPILFYFGIG